MVWWPWLLVAFVAGVLAYRLVVKFSFRFLAKHGGLKVIMPRGGLDAVQH